MEYNHSGTYSIGMGLFKLNWITDILIKFLPDSKKLDMTINVLAALLRTYCKNLARFECLSGAAITVAHPVLL